MSHLYESRVYSVEIDLMPDSPESVAKYQELTQRAQEIAARKEDAIHYLFGSTRNGWAISTLADMLKEGEFSELLFLTDEKPQSTFEDEHGCINMISIISGEQLRNAIDSMEKLITQLKANSDLAYRAEKSGVFDEHDVDEALQRSYVCSNPAQDRQVHGDEGMSADYLFVFIRSILALLKNAHKDGLAVIYELSF